MGLKGALTKLDRAVEDLTSLHVQTFTGELDIEITGKEEFSSFRESVKKSKDSGKISLVAETLAQFDGDSYNFITKDLNNIPEIALELHQNAVESGIETRLGLLTLFKDLLTDITTEAVPSGK